MSIRRIFNDLWSSGGAATDPGGVKTALGWIAEKPPYQYFNWWQKRADEALQHLERTGIAIWDALTVYETNGVARGSDGNLYQAVAGSTNVNPVGTVVAPTYLTASWKRITPPATESASGLIELATTGEVAALSDVGRAVTPAGLNALAASTTQRGIAELATGTETAALTDAARTVTPLGLASLVASTVTKGIVELATSAEVVTGTDNTRAVTPEALGSLLQSIGTNGYKIFPGGLIVQWGSQAVTANTTVNVTLPIAYPTAHLWAICGANVIPSPGVTGQPASARPGNTSPLTQVDIRNSTGTQFDLYWLSIGH